MLLLMVVVVLLLLLLLLLPELLPPTHSRCIPDAASLPTAGVCAHIAVRAGAELMHRLAWRVTRGVGRDEETRSPRLLTM